MTKELFRCFRCDVSKPGSAFSPSFIRSETYVCRACVRHDEQVPKSVSGEVWAQIKAQHVKHLAETRKERGVDERRQRRQPKMYLVGICVTREKPIFHRMRRNRKCCRKN
jgi:hypothetical protein